MAREQRRLSLEEVGNEPALMGRRIRDLRKAAGLTLAQVSAKTGLSISYLSQIERNISHPSIRALSDIADAFDVSMGWLFRSEMRQGPGEGRYVVRRHERGVMDLTPGIREEVLSPDLDGPLKLFSTTLQPGAESGTSATSHKGAEAGLVVSGEMVLYLEDESYRLRAGDSFAFSSQVPHRFLNDTREPAVIVWSVAVDSI